MTRKKKKCLRSEALAAARAVGRVIEGFEVTALCAGVGCLALLLIVNVIARTFFHSLYFAEELSEFLVLFTTFVGISYAVRKARHIRMGAIFDALPRRAQKVMITIISAISAAVMFLMAYFAFRYFNSARMLGHSTPALRLPYWVFLVIVPLGFLSAGLQYIRTLFKNAAEHEVWLSPEQQSEYDEEG